MNRRHWFKCFLFIKIAALSTLVFGSSSKIDVPLFLFSGQSNMVGLGTNTSQLSAGEKASIENIKIYQETEGAHKGEWLTLGPGFGGSNTQFGPELFFGKVLSDSMPDKKIAFIKDAASGTYLGKAVGWLSPSSGGPGTLYRNMMTHIEAALKSFNNAYDTSLYTPRWAGFIWHQGEFDGMDQSLANKYEENLTNLIKDIREMAKTENLPAIIPMITDISMWQFNAKIRSAEIAVTEKLINCDTTDTKGFNLSDGVHYDTPNMKKIGNTCAIRWLAMEFTKDWWKQETTSVAYQIKPLGHSKFSSLPSNTTIFDLSGRKFSTSSFANQLKHRPSTLTIGITTSKTNEKQISKELNLKR